MPSKKKLSSFCAEVHSDDGLDPRDYFRKEDRPNRAGRKALQLCSQVADTLNLVLGGESADPILQSLQIAEVRPAPDASQLLVLMIPASGSDPASAGEVEAALARAVGWLRTEVAAAITRKRAPQLMFRYVPTTPPMPASGEEENDA
jgi:ribosome-binding factor A